MFFFIVFFCFSPLLSLSFLLSHFSPTFNRNTNENRLGIIVYPVDHPGNVDEGPSPLPPLSLSPTPPLSLSSFSFFSYFFPPPLPLRWTRRRPPNRPRCYCSICWFVSLPFLFLPSPFSLLPSPFSLFPSLFLPSPSPPCLPLSLPLFPSPYTRTHTHTHTHIFIYRGLGLANSHPR